MINCHWFDIKYCLISCICNQLNRRSNYYGTVQTFLFNSQYYKTITWWLPASILAPEEVNKKRAFKHSSKTLLDRTAVICYLTDYIICKCLVNQWSQNKDTVITWHFCRYITEPEEAYICHAGTSYRTRNKKVYIIVWNSMK